MTGRPLNIDLDNCTTPLPVPYPEENFLDDRVARVIADESTRKAIVASFVPRAISKDGEDHKLPPPFLHPIVGKVRENEQDATAAPESRYAIGHESGCISGFFKCPTLLELPSW
jgi:hypothetical protein